MTDGEQSDLLALVENLAASDGQEVEIAGELHPLAGSPRIADGHRPLVIVQRREEHVAQLFLVFRGHHHQVGHRAQIGDIKDAMVGGSVISDNAGAVDGEHHRQLLQGDIVDEMIVGAL